MVVIVFGCYCPEAVIDEVRSPSVTLTMVGAVACDPFVPLAVLGNIFPRKRNTPAPATTITTAIMIHTFPRVFNVFLLS